MATCHALVVVGVGVRGGGWESAKFKTLACSHEIKSLNQAVPNVFKLVFGFHHFKWINREIIE